MNHSPTLTHALAPEEKQNKVELRRRLRRSLRNDDTRITLFGSRLEVALFGLAALALIATPALKASVKAKDELIEIAARLKPSANPDDGIVTGTVSPTRPATVRGGPADKPALRGTL